MVEALLRQNEGWLGPLERPALAWLAPRMPVWINPDRLSAIGMAGALICLIGYAWAAVNPAGLWLASVGLAVNWFGDSLDGSLARYRKIERPRYGYFLDNSLDVVQQFMITIGVGLSGYLRWDVCLLALSVFLMLSVLTFLRAYIAGVYQLTYGRVGPTEMRVLGIVLNAMVFFFPPDQFDWLELPLTYPNILSLMWSMGGLITFSISLVNQLRALAIEDPPREH